MVRGRDIYCEYGRGKKLGYQREFDADSGQYMETAYTSVVSHAVKKDLLVVPDSPDLSKEPIPTLEEFLLQYAIDDTEFVTHTSMNGLPFPGKWSIPIEGNWNFLRVFYHHLFVKKRPAFISERIEKEKAYYFFMDFDFDLIR